MLLAIVCQAGLPQTFLCLKLQFALKDLMVGSLTIISISYFFSLFYQALCFSVIAL